MKKRACVDQKLCVACGCCLSACKIGAISIPNGVCAMIDETKCVGCAICFWILQYYADINFARTGNDGTF